MSTARNAQCPCGSGLKFKRWCGAVSADGSIAPENDPEAGSGPATSAWKARLPIIGMFAIDIAIGVWVWVAMESVANGVAVFMALAMGTGIYLTIRQPPESTGRGGGSAIDFGMGQNRRKSRNSVQNRRQRRRK
jgi:hypothetical protein